MAGPDPFAGWDPECSVCDIDYAASTSSVKNAQFERTLIIDRIFKILVKLLDTLQKATAAQSDRLQFLTQWQKAYTDSMDQVHSFVANNGDAIDKADESDETPQRDARDDLNRVNATYTEQLRARRSVISDDAKQLQTNINQGSDAVQQAQDLAQALLQQLSTILGVIFK